jgi:hypothetical protein
MFRTCRKESDVKEFWKSKTLWFQAIAIVVFVASSFGYADFMPDADLMAIVAAVVNIALRFRTDQALSLGRL